MREKARHYVGAPVRKKDARALVTGKPVYTDDIAPRDCLIVKVLRSPHAHALITSIDIKKAAALEGIETVLTWQDVPQKRFTMAGQTYPEPSPYDRLILDRRLRFVGDAVAILDPETGAYELIDYVAVVDCGTAINPNLVRVQTEGGLAQGIGMAMYEEVSRSNKGQVYENSFMQYKVPTRMDIGDIRVEMAGSYEPTGPFGAKSIGEIVINTPAPAIAGAVANAAGVYIRELPVTAEKIYYGMQSAVRE